MNTLHSQFFSDIFILQTIYSGDSFAWPKNSDFSCLYFARVNVSQPNTLPVLKTCNCITCRQRQLVLCAGHFRIWVCTEGAAEATTKAFQQTNTSSCNTNTGNSQVICGTSVVSAVLLHQLSSDYGHYITF